MAEHVYDSSDSCTGKSAVQEPLEYSIYGLLKKYQITITTAESATGGMIASTLINVPGISEFFTEGYVTYSNEAKVKMILECTGNDLGRRCRTGINQHNDRDFRVYRLCSGTEFLTWNIGIALR